MTAQRKKAKAPPLRVWVAIHRDVRVAFRYTSTSKAALVAQLNHDTGGRADNYDLHRYVLLAAIQEPRP